MDNRWVSEEEKGRIKQTHLEMPLRIEEQVLRFYIPMRHALAMEVGHAAKYLLKTALDFAGRHPPFLDRSIQIASWTKFHHFAPMLVLILHEIDGLNNVGMVEGGGDAEFGGELLDIFFFCFVLSSLAELLR